MKRVFALIGVFLLGWAIFIVASLAARFASHFGLVSSEAASHALLKTVLVGLSLAVMALSRRRLAEFGFRRAVGVRWLRVICLGLVLGAIGVLVVILSPAEGMKPTGTFWQMIVGIWIYSSVTEEIHARGLVQGLLDEYRQHTASVLGVRLSVPVLTAALLFATLHAPLLLAGVDALTVAIVLVFTFVVGTAAGVLRERYGSLLPAIVIHVAANVGGFLGGVVYAVIHVLVYGEPPGMPSGGG